jgi:hypothetical protein
MIQIVMPAPVEVGAVYQWSRNETLMRVLVIGSGVVMYDAWWPHLGSWGLARLQEIKRQRISYYVTTVATVTEKAMYLRTEALTEDELALHRPDLPFSVAQCAAVQWPAEPYDTTAQRSVCLSAVGCPSVGGDAVFDVPEIVLCPFGPNGGTKTGVRVKADDGIAFTLDELVWKAQAVQAPFIGTTMPTRGVGIYRSGLQRGIPSYYLWGSESRLDS